MSREIKKSEYITYVIHELSRIFVNNVEDFYIKSELIIELAEHISYSNNIHDAIDKSKHLSEKYITYDRIIEIYN